MQGISAIRRDPAWVQRKPETTCLKRIDGCGRRRTGAVLPTSPSGSQGDAVSGPIDGGPPTQDSHSCPGLGGCPAPLPLAETPQATIDSLLRTLLLHLAAEQVYDSVDPLALALVPSSSSPGDGATIVGGQLSPWLGPALLPLARASRACGSPVKRI